MAVLTTGNTFANGDQVTAGSLNNAVNDAEFAAGAVDGISTQKSGSGAIIVKDLGISRGKIAIDAVGTDQLANDVVISTSGSITGSAGSFTTLSASGDISVDGSVKQSGNTGNLTLKGGDTDGANIELYGASSSEANKAFYDASTHSFRPEDGSSSRVVISSSGLTASGDLTVDTTTLKVDSTNNRVGIGTASPSNTLHVENTTSSGAYINYDGQSNTEFGLRIESNADGGDFESDFANGSTALLDLYANSASVSGGDLLVARTQSATPVLLVKGSGNVGIGTASPANSLHVVGDDQETSSINTALATSLEVSGNGTLTNSGGTILFSAASGLWKFAAIKSLVTSGSDSSIGHLAFCTRRASNDSTLTEAMRIQYDGKVGIGTTAPVSKLDVKQSADGFELGVSVTRDGASRGTIYLDASSNTLNISRGSTDSISIDSAGNVGIGDSTPSFKLDVNGTGRFTSTVRFDGQTQNYNGAYDIYRSGAGYVRHRIADQSLYLGVTNTAGTVHYPIVMSPINDALIFNNEEGEMARFDTSGNLGIGTSSPAAILQTSTADNMVASFKSTDATAYVQIIDSVDATYIGSQSGIGFIGGSADVSSNNININLSNGNVGIGEISPDVLLHVGTGSIYQNKTGTGAFPGLQNDTHGTMVESQGANGSTLHVSRKGNVAASFARNSNSDAVVNFYSTAAGGTSAASLAGTIDIDSATTVSIQSASDYRLKENIVPVTDGIDRLMQMPVYKFNFTHNANRVVDGFLAHEVQPQVPEAVKGEKDAMKDEEYMVSPAVYEDVVHPAVEATYDEDGNELTPAVEEWTESVLVSEAVMGTRMVPKYQTMDQSKLVPLLTAALQEAVAKIEALEARVQTLEG